MFERIDWNFERPMARLVTHGGPYNILFNFLVSGQVSVYKRDECQFETKAAKHIARAYYGTYYPLAILDHVGLHRSHDPSHGA